ncbi:protein vestigial isoform X2 [Thrips palmi]|uniref:Protein vestigial isoform X2 n=1 Tax=Thrips palmi TaxID=161013 RepID=A0A6P8ZLF5_THRPL|nr:protein vestigial isoform X2 [Thrips palmi]
MTMSCPEVVYQAYYPYLYQRPSAAAHSSARAAAFPPFSHQYDRFNVQRSLEQPSSSLGESSAASVASVGAASSAAGSAGGSGYLGLSHHPPSSVGSVSSGGGGVGSPGSPPLSAPSLPRHKEEDSGGPRSADAVADDEETEALHAVDLDSSRDSAHGHGQHGHAQYLSANCVVFTHYSGDAASVVDEHFTRALAYADTKASALGKESSPMTARNFPASFWNSNYHASGLGGMAGVGGLGAAGVAGMAGMGVPGVSHHGDLYGDPYHHAASTPTDPWHYPQYSAAAHHHRAVHEYHHHHHNMAAQYGGLLLPPARLPAHAHQYSKEWAPGGHHPHHAHHGQSVAHHHGLEAGPAGYSYPGMAGLEPQVQETSKDLYWI